MTKEEIKDIIEAGEYDVYGLRIDEGMIYKVGDTTENSHQWWQDDPEDDSEYNEDLGLWDGGELNGTCAIEVTEDNIESALEMIKQYFGEHITLIAGYGYEYGNDNGEVIIEDAKVLAVIK